MRKATTTVLSSAALYYCRGCAITNSPLLAALRSLLLVLVWNA